MEPNLNRTNFLLKTIKNKQQIFATYILAGDAKGKILQTKKSGTK